MTTNKVNCLCGCSVNKNYFRVHIYSNKHLEFLYEDNHKTILDYEKIKKDEIHLDLTIKMNQLYEKMDNCVISEGQYLEQCNKLKKDYENAGKVPITFDSEERKGIFKILSEINYRSNKPLISQSTNWYYYNYYLMEDNTIIIVKIDYLSNVLRAML